MTRDDIIRMAREADPFGENGRLYQMAELAPETLARFAALVADAEREACASMAEAFYRHQYDFTGNLELHEAIRARGKK